MTNSEIVDSFLEHKTATVEAPVSTDGKEIKSYGVMVGRWDGKESNCIVMPGTSDTSDKSVTRCRNLVRQRALSKGIKVVQC
jgi:hypothetical protein